MQPPGLLTSSFPVTSPILRSLGAPTLSYLISINSGVIGSALYNQTLLSLRKSKGF